MKEIELEDYGTARELAQKIKNIGDKILDTFNQIGTSATTLFGEDWRSCGSDGAKERYDELAANYQIFYDKIVVDRNANGYRLPYIRELIILSDFEGKLSIEEYEDTFEEKEPFSVYEGKKNRYGIYDLLENLPQYCNDYYLNGYDYSDCEKNPYGPEKYTPNNKATAFVVNGQIDNTEKEPLLCAFGCYSDNETNDSAKEKVIHAISMYDKNNTISIRIVRNLPISESE